MAHQLSFEHLIRYDPAEAGVTVDAALKLFERSVSFAANVDTGSSYCIIERKHGEALGLAIESGLLQPISTVAGRFITYGHQITLCVADLEFDSMITSLPILDHPQRAGTARMAGPDCFRDCGLRRQAPPESIQHSVRRRLMVCITGRTRVGWQSHPTQLPPSLLFLPLFDPESDALRRPRRGPICRARLLALGQQ